MNNPTRSLAAVAGIILCVLTAAAVNAVSPTDEAIAIWKAQGIYEQKIADWKAFKEAGGCAPGDHSLFSRERILAKMALGVDSVETVYVPVILVDFVDYKWNDSTYVLDGQTKLSTRVYGTPSMFESLLFSIKGSPESNPTGSMTDFYMENSNGKFFMIGEVHGWYTMDKPYSYYVGTNSGLGGTGSVLAREAIDSADTHGVDFSRYDNNNNNTVEGVIIVHAGPGAETGQWGIWSHKSGVTQNKDGMRFSQYTLNPEEYGGTISTMGVFAHEYGHVLGLPDLYDVGSNSNASGLGNWSLMSGGSWNQNGRVPAHFDGWCKWNLGFAKATILTQNTRQVEFPQTTTEAVVYLLRNASVSSLDWWIVENRQKVGFDAALPGAGLMIYHYDQGAGAQNDTNRYLVALEQADGLNGLINGSSGDAGDTWPGSTNKRNFTNFTTPNSSTNIGGLTTQVGVWNISNSGPIMYADLDISYSRPWVVLSGGDSIKFSDNLPGGDNDGIFEAGETIKFNMGVLNLAKIAYDTKVTLTCDNPTLTFGGNPGKLETFLNPTFTDPIRMHTPISIVIPADFQSKGVNFTITLNSDSVISLSNGDGLFVTTFQSKVTLGAPQIMLVDDDNAGGFQSRYTVVLDRMNLPYAIWDKSVRGTPPSAELAKYSSVFWFTGSQTAGGTLTAADISAIKQHMDGGGNLCLSSMTVPTQLTTLDSTFMETYLKASAGNSLFATYFYGVPGFEVSDSSRYNTTGGHNGTHRTLTPINGGQSLFTLGTNGSNTSLGTCGVLYDGSYKSVFLSFAIEHLSDGSLNSKPKDSLIARIINFFGKGTATGIDDDQQAGLVPAGFSLAQNYPNPFNPSTTIEYTINGSTGSRIQRVTLAVYNLLGQNVRTLVDQTQGPGTYTVTWDGSNTEGRAVSTGLYFYRLQREGASETKKMVLLK
ncbi:MAG: M6 family metalloprotease domain-containing protein [candidate division Zixibacteria bacterium]|nr:M6 family metalloprotease domain-containing protein [candidate division Zixibacteria bacterium]